MMNTRVLCLLLLAGLLAGAQNTTPSAHETETLLIALENGWNQAQLHHDSRALNEMVADTFISTDNDGILMTKAQFMADNKDLSYAASLMANSDERVFLYGDAAVVAGIYHATRATVLGCISRSVLCLVLPLTRPRHALLNLSPCHDPSKSASPTYEKRLRKSVKKTAGTCEAARNHPAQGITNADFKDCRKS
jgi:hypothetical protein